MKTVIVACGSSMITSSVAASKIKEAAAKEDIKLNVIQCKFSEVAGAIRDSKPDLIVPTGNLKESQTLGVPVIKGMNFITGINEAETLESIMKILRK